MLASVFNDVKLQWKGHKLLSAKILFRKIIVLKTLVNGIFVQYLRK